ncbi:MAG: hypothetical protein ACTHJ5_06875 [Ilyomonas sp.]
MRIAQLSLIALIFSISCNAKADLNATTGAKSDTKDTTITEPVTVTKPALDTAEYDRRVKMLANGDTTGRWPVKAPYPNAGAILPFKRIVAYYGNFYSKKMGILGELPEDEMFAKLQFEVKKWEKADTTTPVQPALHYIAVTAQGAPGKDGKYRLRMPFSQIDKAIEMAKKINALVFLDVQVAHSTLQQEIPALEKYLSMPQVHLGIDPEFSMKNGERPGTVIGTFDAKDVNYVADYLASLVKKNNLPPKVLVVHRFTQRMVTNYQDIKPLPEVQIVMDMDGWGTLPRKRSTYYSFIAPQPVQFTGFKIFYKNDTQRVNAQQEMQPQDVLQLRPIPIYIQYQ